MARPKLLDLYSCAGGAAMGYHRAGFDVIGVDIAEQPNYPFEHHVSDALEFLADHGHEYDAIHASPPCQSYLNLGAVNRKLGRTYEHADLIEATRDLLVASGKPYVIENVEDAKSQLINPVRICGTGLDRPLRRHRLFESNLPLAGINCEHGRFTEKRYWTGYRPKGETVLSTVVQVYGNGGGRHEWPDAMGIDWMTPKEMAEAIPPDYTEWIGTILLRRMFRGVEGSLVACECGVEESAHGSFEPPHMFTPRGDWDDGALRVGQQIAVSPDGLS
jgi:DNA (cytosine-5)-methyltransferase 1